ncbi:hypothetical protein AMR72_08545 [Flavobacterium psychrophilum]|nr:hypothetical protein AMR72_08545 [Flavobacterium psychrophilum]AOE52548.1 hypothetical protein ALW18_08535 [Flavobacterium psychrophilum]
MKYLHFFVFLLISTVSYSQHTLSFSYDNAGNQTKRELICISCRTSNSESNSTSSVENTRELTKSSEYADIMYYPNPVLEELYIKWQNENSHVTEIMVYTNTGQIIFSYKDLLDTDNTKISFQNLSEGMYNVVMIYSNGDQKNLQVIKK